MQVNLTLPGPSNDERSKTQFALYFSEINYNQLPTFANKYFVR